MDGKMRGLLVRSSNNRCNGTGLYRRRTSVQSSLDWRMERATRQGRPFRRSQSGALGRVREAPVDRAPWRKGAQVKRYHIWPPGQTGMCSPSALWFPELAAGREVTR